MIANTVFMVRPAAFGFNAQTAVNNAFQHNLHTFTHKQIQDIALLEFDNMVSVLQENGIEVVLGQDQAKDKTPDSIFPNNWFSTFTNELLLYGMFTENRRRERKTELIEMISEFSNKPVNDSLLAIEEQGHILEGTGSLVCDHHSKTAYAALSPRTDHKALDLFEELSGYNTVRFHASGPDDHEIYHTNVMMTMGDNFVVIGLDTISTNDKERVKRSLIERNKTIIDLSNFQVFKHFAGNMLQLKNADNSKFLIMSAEARNSLSDSQIKIIESRGNTIIAPPIHMIEKIGGGSARCMMAEIFKK